jgi:Cd2+/Zn2+-exporting ATPase
MSFLKAKVEVAGVKVKTEQSSNTNSSKSAPIRVGISGLLVAVGLGVSALTGGKTVPLLVNFAAVLLGGSLVFPKAWRSIRQLRLDINVLMTVAVVGAFAIGDYSEGATVVFLFALSELLESYSVARARKAIREVMDLAPPTAFLILPDGKTIEVPVSDVKIGQTVLVKSGGRIPLDGIVKNGSSLVNQATLTGESVPVAKQPNDQVFAGTLNEAGALEITVSKLFEDSKASQIIRLIEEAQRDKAPAQRFVDTFARYYTPTLFVCAILVFLLPPLFFGGEWATWLYRSLVLLVIACPCALVISTPISVVSGLTALARSGVLVKGGVYLEILGKIRAIAVDKTGTITYGKPTVQAVHPLNGTAPEKILQVAASLESMSSHPLALAVGDYAHANNVALKTASNFKTVVGYGVEAEIEGHHYFLGNHRFAHEIGVCKPELETILSQFERQALSIIVIGHKPHENCDGEALGVIAVGDKIRANAAKAVKRLKDSGIQQVVMLSGDNQTTAESIAKQANIDLVKGGLLPEDKVKEMKSLVAKFGTVAMIGDGINDAPALAESSLGIAMGAAGTDTAIETADVALMKDDLEEVGKAIEKGRQVLSIIRFNIALALAVKGVFLVAAAVGKTNLWLAVAADTGTSLLVIANALRLLRTKK